MSKLNTFVRQARDQLRLSQPAFAAKLGVSLSSVARYERKGYPVPEYVRLAVERLLEQEKDQ